MSWVEDRLREWGAWYRVKGEAQGWGGAVDFDRLFELSRNVRAPGVHSDPILSEVLATEADQQAQMQRVHRHILQCPRTLQLTARLRYAGLWMPVAGEPERGDRLRGGIYYRDVPGLVARQIASLMGCPDSTVYDRLVRLRQRIEAELRLDAEIRKNQRATRLRAA